MLCWGEFYCKKCKQKATDCLNIYVHAVRHSVLRVPGGLEQSSEDSRKRLIAVICELVTHRIASTEVQISRSWSMIG